VFKNQALVIMAVLVLALAMVAISCAPAAKPATTPPATLPAAPLATPPAQAATPVATLPAAPKASWGESKTYSEDTYGLSYLYPAKWINLDPTGIMIYDVASSSESDAENASLSVTAKVDDIANAVRAAYEANPNLSNLNVKVDIVSSRATTLADGKTAATEVVLSAKIMGIYDLYGYNLAVVKGDKLVWCSALTLGTGTKQALCREIVQTFAVK
jgi:hypothetical protein